MYIYIYAYVSCGVARFPWYVPVHKTYVYICICIYMCMYVSIYIITRKLHLNIYILYPLQDLKCIYTYKYTYINISTYMHFCIVLIEYTCMYIEKYRHVYIYKNIDMYIPFPIRQRQPTQQLYNICTHTWTSV
jgi:hypothetical protein